MKILKYKNYRYLFVAQLVSQLGDRIHSLALLWITYKWSQSSSAVGGIMIATTLPGILISPYAGSVVDKFNKSKIMALADLIRGFLVFSLFYISLKGFLNYKILIVISIFLSIASAFFNPSALALLPELIPSKYLTNANALNQMSNSASAVIGPLFGSAIISIIGVPMAFLFNSFSFFFSMFFVLKMNVTILFDKVSSSIINAKNSFLEVINIPILKKLLLPIVIVNFFFSSVVIIVPIVAEGIFHLGAAGIGYMMSAFGTGMLLGTILLSFFKKFNKLLILIVSFLVMGCSFFIMGVFLNFNVSLISLFMAGLCLTVLNIILIVMFQELIPFTNRGKVMAIITGIALSMQPLSYGVTGIILDKITSSTMLIISGIIIFLTGIFTFFIKELKILSNREIKNG